MRSLLYVTTTFPTIAWFLENEVAGLLQRGFRVRVITLRPPSREFQPEHRALLAHTCAIGSPWAPASLAAVLYWLVRRPGVFVGESLRMLWASRRSAFALAGHLGYLPAAARVARIVQQEDIAHVHGAWGHFPASVAYLAARLTDRPFSFAAHAGADVYRTQAFLGEKVRAARFVTACVRENGRVLRTLGGPGSRVLWNYHGVNLRRFDGAGRARSPEPLLLTVGRLAPAKGFDVAIRATALLRQRGIPVRLVMAGEGPERHRLESLVRELGIESAVSLAGTLSAGDLLAWYRSAWLLLMPCVELSNGRRDGIPNVVVEAMAMGMACAGTRAAGMEEIVTPGENGVLAQSGDPVSLADAVEPLLRAPERLDAMGRQARVRVETEFDADRNIELLVRLFDSCREGGVPPADANWLDASPPVAAAATRAGDAGRTSR